MELRRLRDSALLLLAALAAWPATAAAAPSCAEGPETVGATIVGTPCADTIRLPRGVTTVFGEGGDDVLYGQRGNDSLFGGEGADRLYGGVGDDRLRGGPGDDRLFGGFGADSLDGEGGNDLARGDATVDAIGDSGGGSDTLSFAIGVTPGFPNTGSFFTAAGFPPGAEGRGAYVDLGEGIANDGLAPPGGDVAHGGADSDGCVEVAVTDCEQNSEEIHLRDPGSIAVGVVSSGGPAGPAAYLTGSDEHDAVMASYGSGAVTFSLAAGSDGQFDPVAAVAGGCVAPSGGTVSCPVSEAPDSILVAGLAGGDSLSAPGLPETVALVELGNEGDDGLTGGETEDALIDGAGEDTASAGGRDDALPNNGGADRLHAGSGEDLFISNAVCDGDLLDGGADRDNANWANFGAAVSIDMAAHAAGLIGSQGEPHCTSSALLTTLTAIEDVEGTGLGDNLVGDASDNQLLGRDGPDNYLSGAGNDLLLANSGDSDPTLDCGEGFDTALIDFAPIVDGPPVGCESVEERAPNSFRPPDTPPEPEAEPEVQPPPPPPPPPPPRDRQPPATRLRHHPPALLLADGPRRRVSFRFASSEPDSSFRCKLDRQPWRPCRSPRVYQVRRGRHAFRVYAIDAAGNRDRTPALFEFRLR